MRFKRIKIVLLLVLLIVFSMKAWGTQSNLAAGNFPTTSPYSGLTLVQNVNTAMTALSSQNAGSSAPSYALSDMLWADTSNNLLKFTPNGTNWYPLGAFGNSTWTAVSDGVPDDGPTSTGSANAYVVTYSPAPSALVTGHLYKFITSFSNTGSATVNFNALGAIPLKKQGGTSLASGDLGSGAAVTCMYDGANCQITSQVSTTGTGSVTSIATSGQVCGGTITSSGTISLCSQSNDTVLANVSGSSGAPSATATPVATSWGIGAISSASGNEVHSPSTNTVSLSTNGTDALTAYSDQGITTAGAAGGDQGSGTVNATGLYINGVAVGNTSAMKLLATVNCTSASPCSSVTFNSTYITSAYNKYVIEADGLYAPSGGSGQVTFLVSSNNGSSYAVPTCEAVVASSSVSLVTQPLFSSALSVTPTNTTSTTLKFSIGSSSVNQTFQVGPSSSNGTSSLIGNGCAINLGATMNAIQITVASSNEVGNFHLYALTGN